MDRFSVVEAHAEGESFDVVIGGNNYATCNNMHEKQRRFRDKHEKAISQLLGRLQGRDERNAVFLLDAIQPNGDRALVFTRDGEFVPISISGIISLMGVLTSLPGICGISPSLSTTKYSFETLAGDVRVDLNYESNAAAKRHWDLVTVHNVASFAFKTNYPIHVPGLGQVRVDIAYGGVMCAFVDAASVGLEIQTEQRQRLFQMSEKIKRAIRGTYTPVHPLDPAICGVSSVVFTQKVRQEGWRKETLSAIFVSPGRLDRSPSGTATSALLAILHACGEIQDEVLVNRCLTGGVHCARVICETTVGEHKAILPMLKGRACITAIKDLDPNLNNSFRREPYVASLSGPDLWTGAVESTRIPQEPKSGSKYKIIDMKYPRRRRKMLWDAVGACRCRMCIAWRVWNILFACGTMLPLVIWWLHSSFGWRLKEVFYFALEYGPKGLICFSLEVLVLGLEYLDFIMRALGVPRFLHP